MDRSVTVEISHLVLFCFLYYIARFHERENIFNNDYAFYYHSSALFSAVIGLTVHPSVTQSCGFHFSPNGSPKTSFTKVKTLRTKERERNIASEKSYYHH